MRWAASAHRANTAAISPQLPRTLLKAVALRGVEDVEPRLLDKSEQIDIVLGGDSAQQMVTA